MSVKSSTEIKVGIFVLFILSVVVFLIIYIGIKKELFSEKVRYFVISTTGEKVERGIPVKISGFRIGQVSNVYMDDVSRIKIEIEVVKKHMPRFRKGTKINLDSGFPIGTASLNVTPGPEGSLVLRPDSTLELSMGEDLLSSLQKDAQPVIADIKIIVSNVRKITDRMLDNDGNFQQVLANMQRLTSDMVEGEGLLHMLTRDKEAAKKFRSTLNQGDLLLTNLNRLSKEAAKQVDEFGPFLKRLTSDMVEGEGLLHMFTKDKEAAKKFRSILNQGDLLLANLNRLSKEAVKQVDELGPFGQDLHALAISIEGFLKEITALSHKLDPSISNVNAITGEVRKATRDLERLREQVEYTVRFGNDLLFRLNQVWPLSGGKKPEPPQDYPVP